MSLAVGLLVDEEDLLLFVLWGSFSSLSLFFLLAVESLKSPWKWARSLQKLGQVMENGLRYT